MGISADLQKWYIKTIPGCNQKVEPLDLKDRWVEVAQNVRFDPAPGSVDKRDPVTYLNSSAATTYAVTGLYRFYTSNGGASWVSLQDTYAIYTNDTGYSSNIRTGLTTGKRASFVTYKDLMICSNGYDNPWVWDGVTTATTSSDPYAKLLCHMDGTDGADTFTDEVGKTVTGTLGSSVVLLTHADGTNGAVAFTDSAAGAKAITNTATYDSYTKVCSHFDGADDAVAYTDPIAGAYTFVGHAHLHTGDKKFGSASLALDGIDDYVTLPDSVDFNFGVGNFTIDFWINFSALPAGEAVPFAQTGSGGGRYTFFVNTNGTTYEFEVKDAAGALIFDKSFVGADSLATGIWYHMAIVRYGNTLNIYRDGVLKGTDTFNITMPDLDETLKVGTQDGAIRFVNGYIDEFRISKGITRWTANFTKPAYPYGQVVVSTTQKKFGTASAYFDGSGSNITLADAADWNFGTGNFTIDCWTRFNAIGKIQVICGQYEDADNYWFVEIDAANKLHLKFVDGAASKGDYIMTSAWGLAVNTLYHLAFVRSTTSAKIFIDGVSQTLTETTAFSTNNVGDVAGDLVIGQQNSVSYFDGYIDELCVTKGQALWTTDFTPNTYAYGTPVTSTTQYKFGQGGYFSGNSYLATADHADWNMGTGDFTIDFCVRFNVIGQEQVFISQYDSATAYFSFELTAANKLQFYAYDTTAKARYIMTSAWAGLAIGEWHHVALVRSTTAALIFIDGVSQTLTETTAFSTNAMPDLAGELQIGAYNAGTYFNGWMDEFRVSKGTARWTAQFIPSTVPYSLTVSTSYVGYTWELGACKCVQSVSTGSMDTGAIYYYAVTMGIGTADQYVCGAVSNNITTSTSGKVTVSQIPLGPVGTDKRRIYRTEGGGSALKLLHELTDNTTTTYEDTVADGSLTTAYPAVTDDMPKGALLTLYRERLFIAGNPNYPNKIYYSNVYLPHYIQQTTNLDYMDISPDDGDEIMGIPIQLDVMVCIKKNSIRKLTITSPTSGADPTTWYAGNPISWVGSPAMWSITQTPNGVVFLGYEHWYIFDGAGAKPIFDEFDVLDMLDSSLSDTVGYYHRGVFVAAYTTKVAASQQHDSIMRYDFKREALGIDVWTSGTVYGANCFCARTGDDEPGDLFYGDSKNGYIVKDQITDNIYSLRTKTECNQGTLTDVFVGGTENEPYIEIGATTTADVIPNDICIFWDDPDTTPGAGWTEITGYDNRLIKISTTALTTAGGTTHAHTLTGSIPMWYGTVCNVGDSAPSIVAAHSHEVSYAADASAPLPRNIIYRMFKKDSGSLDTEFPNGAIVMWDQATAPEGWLLLPDVGYYIRQGSYGAIDSAILNFGGTGYTVGDILTIDGGTGGQVRVASVSSGVVTAITLYAPGLSYDTIVGAETTGAGSGCTVDIVITDFNMPISSVHNHSFNIPTGTAAGNLAQSDGGTNAPAFGHNHMVSGVLSNATMDSWELAHVKMSFIKKVGESSTWDGVVKYVYALYASASTPTGWTDVSSTYDTKYLKIGSGTPEIVAASGASHTHVAGTFTTSEESALGGNNGYHATGYAAPHTHSVSLSASTTSASTPPSVTFRMFKYVLGKMKAYNTAIGTQYTAGTWTSPSMQIDAQTLNNLYWNPYVLGASDSVKFYSRTGSTKAICEAAAWSVAYTDPNGSPVVSAASAWFQYKIVFSAVDTRITNPQVYFSNGYVAKLTYYTGSVLAETSVNFIYKTGYRNFDEPGMDKIFKKIVLKHEGTDGSVYVGWNTENSSTTFTFLLASYPQQWDSYFPSTAMGKQINFTISKNDNSSFRLSEIEGLYSPMVMII